MPDRRLPLAALALVSLAACSPAPPQVLGTLERDRIALPAPAFEPIVEIAVREGEQVAAGAVLVRLDEARSRAALAAAQAEVRRLGDVLAERQAGARGEEREQARAQIAAAAALERNARLERERVDALLARGLVPRAQADAAGAAHDSAAASLRAARAASALLEQGTRAEQIAQADAALAAAQAQVDRLAVDLQRLRVHAPRAGIVDSLPYEVGDQVAIGAPLVHLLVGDAPYARVYVPQPLRADVHVGDGVRVLLEGETRAFAGRVRMIRSTPSFTPYYALHGDDAARLSYLAEVQLGAEAAALAVGLPLRVEIEAGEK
ncbi:HlyD family secretion protein [Chiayiivirga flava]|uniref:HlyD family secretion protein n=1 Tax=Chiayiivirga flava TaxID=659595 RepID=A0A7W8D3P5_9GAMM|nr:HlyD family efflux transporter periplasmic adaptor subunit [Chiayiivirga flava]MBB5207373.1 HlyD family secretion protein [Chiayiivirga flava]